MVTGGSGFVGQRLVEMLLERGAKHVTSMDIVPMPAESALLKVRPEGERDVTGYRGKGCIRFACTWKCVLQEMSH